jgi:Cu/Ag efflux pump CusA
MNRIVELALRQRMLVLGLLMAVILAGIFGYLNLNIEAYPDPVPPMVEIITQSDGVSAEEIERNVTTPIEVSVAGLPHLTVVRSISARPSSWCWAGCRSCRSCRAGCGRSSRQPARSAKSIATG